MSELNRQLLSAVENAELENVKELINKNEYDLDSSEGYDLLCKAIIFDYTEITKLLLSSGCRVNSKILPSNTPLHFAVQNGDKEIVELLLNNKADVYAKNEANWNPVLTAVRMDNQEIVDLLWSKGPYHKNNHKWINPLPIAIEHNLYKMTEKLLKLGTPVSIAYHSGKQYTPLYLAAKVGGRNCLIVELLLKHAADVNFKTTKGLTPLHVASAKGNMKIVRLLLSYNADVNALTNNMLTPLYLAVNNCRQPVARCLMYYGANVDAECENGQTVLNLAVSKQLTKIVVDILEYYPDKNIISNKRLLSIAAMNCSSRKKFMKLKTILEEHGFSIEPDDISDTDLLHTAIKEGYFQLIKDLTKHGLDMACIMEDNGTMLHIAAKYNKFEIAEFLLSHGCDINATDNAGQTAIQYSLQVDENYSRMTLLLLSHGASDKNYMEILRHGLLQCWRLVVKFLISNLVDIEATFEDGMKAVHQFSRCKYSSDSFWYASSRIFEFLISKGANFNARTSKEQRTALHIACKEGHFSVVEKVLGHTAEINARDFEGKTALHFCFQRAGDYPAQLLLKAGADISILDNNNNLAYDTFNFKIIMSAKNYWRDSTILHAYKCEAEMQKLKIEKIASNNKLSFYDIFRRSIFSLAKCCRKEDLIRIYESNNYKTKFPIYAHVIEKKLVKSIQRLNLLAQVKENLKYSFELPYVCYDYIFRYLSDSDLENIVNVAV